MIFMEFIAQRAILTARSFAAWVRLPLQCSSTARICCFRARPKSVGCRWRSFRHCLWIQRRRRVKPPPAGIGSYPGARVGAKRRLTQNDSGVRLHSAAPDIAWPGMVCQHAHRLRREASGNGTMLPANAARILLPDWGHLPGARAKEAQGSEPH